MAEDETVDFIENNGAEDCWYTTYENLGYETTEANINESGEFLAGVEEANKQYSQLNDFHVLVECERSAEAVAAEEESGDQHVEHILPDYGPSEDSINEDLSKHNLVMKEIITEQGLIKECYFCHECCSEYRDINDFLQQHPGIELLNEKPAEEDGVDDDHVIEDIVEQHEQFVAVEQQSEILQNEEQTQDKLWELVENIVENGEDNKDVNDGVVVAAADDEENDDSTMSDLIQLNRQPQKDADPVSNETNANNVLDIKSEHYFCYECHQLFSDLKSAEEHDCGNTKVNEDAESPAAEEDLPQEEKDDLICSYCQKMCSSLDELINHMTNCEQNDLIPLKTSGQELFTCDICQKSYPNLRSLYNHQRLHKRVKEGAVPPKPVKCEICNTIFRTPKNLKLHMKMHNDPSVKSIQEALPAGALPEYNELNQFFCEICNKSFDQRLLGIHKNMHQNIEEYNCSKCNKQFYNIRDYEMHMQMHYETKNNNSNHNNNNHVTAATSNPPTSSSDIVGSGETSQNPNKKHACQYCGKEFQRPYEKVKHERVHTGEKPYNCEVCGKSFRVSYSLTLHLRTHTDIRPYVCAICNKRFKQQSVYVHHLKTHDTERQYKCEECGKGFRTSVQLCGHRNSHKKPFNCTECNRPFSSMYAVKVHMKTHSKNNKANKNLSNRCDLCGASYARLFALRIHMKEQHGIEMDSSMADSESSSSPANKKYKTTVSGNAKTSSNNNNMDFIDGDDDDGNSNELSNQHDADLDETEAATQTIMPKEDIIVDNASEQIIMEWFQ